MMFCLERWCEEVSSADALLLVGDRGFDDNDG